MLTLSTGQGVHTFTLDPNIGELFLLHPTFEQAGGAATEGVNRILDVKPR